MTSMGQEPFGPSRLSGRPAPHLAAHLLDAAVHHARGCFMGFDGEAMAVGLERAYHAGAFVEFLSKATVAAVAPALLVEPNDLESQAAVLRLGGSVDPTAMANMRTIAAMRALQMSEAATCRPKSEAARRILSLRNGAVHMAITPADELEIPDLLAAWIRMVFPVVGLTEDDFLGEEVAKVMAEAFGDLQVRTRKKIKEAGDRFHSWFDGKNPTQQALIRAAKEDLAKAPRHDYLEQIGCPACDSQAWLLGQLDVWGEYEGPGETSLEWAIAMELLCGVCGLELDEVELAAIGIEPQPDWDI